MDEFRKKVFAPPLSDNDGGRHSIAITYGPSVAKSTTSSSGAVGKDDEFADFKSFYQNSSASSYCTFIRKIMNEMGIASLADLDGCIDVAIDYCTARMRDPQKETEKKKYNDIRSALRKYKEYLNS